MLGAASDRPFSLLEVLPFCEVTMNAERADPGPRPLKETRGEVAVSLRSLVKTTVLCDVLPCSHPVTLAAVLGRERSVILHGWP